MKTRCPNKTDDGKEITIQAKPETADYPLTLTGTYLHRTNKMLFEIVLADHTSVLCRDEWVRIA